MKISRRAVMLGNLSLLAEGAIGSVARADLASQESVLSAAVDAYIYGYPLAIMDMTRRQLANVATAGPQPDITSTAGSGWSLYESCKMPCALPLASGGTTR